MLSAFKECRMGIDEILKLIEVVQGTDIQELEVASGDWKVRIARNLPHTAAAVAHAVPTHHTHVPVEPPAAAGGMAAVVVSIAENNLIQFNSPMVGTFYRASEPGVEPYVKENDTVASGQTLCIIEAMKLMNDIPSEVSARVVKILVEDGQPVEYDQPLFLLGPA